ncbi:hypothetical protein [Kitasatospora cheerisanensis]|uniref:Uncharacterized protein n=1 Tax=Kitasatospora cheerisanensis KCTC 2395 TaxID=1348663 RepID=A0A066YM41_9ACTN|nr:hypothetical protein [Kitasatospora cheerisanensis]KDN82187.1 hypothetical protein KCH_60210 [Kitasatospora cheerisanensis KCTC 2395]
MSRTAKGLVALAIGAAVVAGVPALAGASTTETHRAATPPTLNLDFSGTNSEAGAATAVGAGFGGTATMTNAAGTGIGTAYDMCDKDKLSLNAITAFCTVDLAFVTGDQVTFSAVVPIQDPLTATYPISFDGVITGGTGAYQGLTGAVHISNTDLGKYNLTW